MPRLGPAAASPSLDLAEQSAADVDSGHRVNGLRTALAWQADERLLLFVEGLRASDSTNLRNAGLRLWAIPGVLGLDLVSTRSAAGGLSIGFGFGWYGISLP
jgi:hypothetical protein